MFIIAKGDPEDGFDFIGPFSEISDAMLYWKQRLDSDPKSTIIQLHEPVNDEPE